jgi:hypothetical protein
MAVFSREQHAANFIEKATKKFEGKFKYHLVDYVNNCTPVLIECPDHGVYLQKPIDHVSSKIGCPKCAIEKNGKACRKSLSTVIAEFNGVHGVGTYDYSNIQYTGMDKNIEIYCPRHNITFKQTPRTHLKGCKCSLCTKEDGKANRLTQDQAIANFNSIHGEGTFLYDEVVYETSTVPVLIKCPRHNHSYLQKPMDHLAAKNGGCEHCARESARSKKEAELLIAFNDKFNGKFTYEGFHYVDVDTKIEMHCKDHGYFYQTATQHLASEFGCPKCANIQRGLNRRLTQDEVIDMFNDTHGLGTYLYHRVEYTTSITPVEIYCPRHEEYFFQTPNNHLQGSGCNKCGVESAARLQKNDLSDMLAEMDRVHDGLYGYHLITPYDYENAKSKLPIWCDTHGVFHQTYASHINGSGCPKCADARVGEYHLDSVEKVLSDFYNTHLDKYDYSAVVYVNSQTKVEIICKVEGHGSFWQTPSKHKSGQNCPLCVADEFKNNNPNIGKKTGPSPSRLSTQEFIDRSTVIHNGFYDYSPTVYTGNHNKVFIRCPIHNEVFEITAGKHLYRSQGCPKCALSKQKSKIGDSWIATLGVNVIPEYPLPNVRFRKVDGYDPTTNTVYQFHGDFYHGNPNHPKQPADKMNTLLKKTFGELYENTQRLDQEIRDAGYNLVIMWELDWRRISNQPKK